MTDPTPISEMLKGIRKPICRGETCGATVLWAVEAGTGKKIPLDTRPPVYEVTGTAGPHGPPIVERRPHAFVSHFATCPDARTFSGTARKREPSRE